MPEQQRQPLHERNFDQHERDADRGERQRGHSVLADGASFTPLDVNTAVTVGKTGASLTGSTNIDVIVTYALE